MLHINICIFLYMRANIYQIPYLYKYSSGYK
nr:MAG TPA: hypothetical protein [Caudoviricetes sp.]